MNIQTAAMIRLADANHDRQQPGCRTGSSRECAKQGNNMGGAARMSGLGNANIARLE
jgi:DNA (cytosine-5)-methyltransferase 1